jgi:hypothetical protein
MRITIILGTLVLGLGLGLSPATAQMKGTDKAFCAEGGKDRSGPECTYDTMAQCQAAIKGQSVAKCIANPKMATKK